MNRFIYLLLGLALCFYLYSSAPVKFEMLIVKASYVSVGSIIGYYIDYLLFPKMRVQDLEHELETEMREEYFKGRAQILAFAQLRRASVIGCAVLGICFGF